MAEETRSTEGVNSTQLTKAFVVRILSRQKAKISYRLAARVMFVNRPTCLHFSVHQSAGDLFLLALT